jgi:phospholipid/cholesterol/gamma-HCH transport system substrate-binding protein
MPPSNKVAWSQLKVGILAAISCALITVLIFLMTGANNPFSEKFRVTTYFPDSAAMTEGSTVRLNGILVGKVRQIELTGSPDNNRAVRMTMEIEERYRASIPVDSEVGFSAENVLGTKYLNIQRGKSRDIVRNGMELHARDDKDFMEMLRSAYPLLDSMQTILQRVDVMVSQLESGKGSLGKLLYDPELYDKVKAILDDFQKVTGALASGQGVMGKLIYDESLYTEVRGTVQRLDRVIANLEAGQGTAGKLLKDPALYDDFKQTTTELHTLVTNLNAGKGTAGKLLTDDTLHARLVTTLERLNSTLDKVNGGQGTIGQLMVNPALYQNLTATSDEMRVFMKEFRANPKKFLSIKMKLF